MNGLTRCFMIGFVLLLAIQVSLAGKKRRIYIWVVL